MAIDIVLMFFREWQSFSLSTADTCLPEALPYLSDESQDGLFSPSLRDREFTISTKDEINFVVFGERSHQWEKHLYNQGILQGDLLPTLSHDEWKMRVPCYMTGHPPSHTENPAHHTSSQNRLLAISQMHRWLCRGGKQTAKLPLLS